MRILTICLLLVGCGEDNLPLQQDLSVLADLSSHPDRTALLNCKQTQACAQACPAANLNTCIPACIDQLDPAAQSYFQALQTCAGPTCTVVDGGAGPCSNPGSAACNTCVMQNCATQEAACQAH